MSERNATAAFWFPEALIGSSRQTTEPTYCLPLGSAGSSSYSTTRCATGAAWSLDDGWLTRSAIFGFDSGAPPSLGASTAVADGLNRPLTVDTSDLPHRIAAPTRIRTMPIAIALLNGNATPDRPGFLGSRPWSCPRRGRGAGCCGGARRAASSLGSSYEWGASGSAPRFSIFGSSRSNSGE